MDEIKKTIGALNGRICSTMGPNDVLSIALAILHLSNAAVALSTIPKSK